VSRRRFTAADAVLLAGLLLANGALWYRRDAAPPGAVEVVSTAGTRTEELVPSREIAVAGPLGETRVLVEPDGVRVLESPCPQKLCIAAGKITRDGEVVACLPNRVALRLLGGGRGEDVDAVGR